jgi:hypothetical protein
MQTLAILDHLGVRELGGLKGAIGSEALPNDQVVLDAGEPVLGRGVVPTIALGAHRADHTALRQLRLERLTRELATPIGMGDEPPCRLAPKPTHGQRDGEEFGRHAGLQRPAHDLSVKQLKHDDQAKPAFICLQVGDVGTPDLTWAARGEFARKQVVGYRQAVLGVGRGHLTAILPRPGGVLVRKALHPCLTRRREGPSAQYDHHPGTAAVEDLDLGMDGRDQGQQLRILQPLEIGCAATLPGSGRRHRRRRHYVARAGAMRSLCASIHAHFTAHPAQSTP